MTYHLPQNPSIRYLGMVCAFGSYANIKTISLQFVYEGGEVMLWSLGVNAVLLVLLYCALQEIKELQQKQRAWKRRYYAKNKDNLHDLSALEWYSK